MSNCEDDGSEFTGGQCKLLMEPSIWERRDLMLIFETKKSLKGFFARVFAVIKSDRADGFPT